jgi:succinoglycan biosynthesis protein ExoM
VGVQRGEICYTYAMNVTIGIITFQRPLWLAQTLSALAGQTFTTDPAPKVQVLVVDNDSQGSAKAVCDEARSKGLDLIYLTEPDKGIPTARNRVLSALPDECDALAWINDNGLPEANWLQNLLNNLVESETDIVMGATEALLPEGAPDWIKRAGFFNRRRFVDYASLAEGASNNCLMRVSALRRAGLRYDEALDEYGGSDTLFFRQAAARGLGMVWAAGALVREQITPARASLGWLLRRNFRSGTTLAYCDLKMDGALGWIRRFGRALQKLAQGLICLPLALTGYHEFVRALLTLARGTGMLLGLFGLRYRESV